MISVKKHKNRFSVNSQNLLYTIFCESTEVIMQCNLRIHGLLCAFLITKGAKPSKVLPTIIKQFMYNGSGKTKVIALRHASFSIFSGKENCFNTIILDFMRLQRNTVNS